MPFHNQPQKHERNNHFKVKANEIYGVSTDGIWTTLNEVYVLNCIGTGTLANEQRQPVTMNRQSGPSPTHTYEDIII